MYPKTEGKSKRGLTSRHINAALFHEGKNEITGTERNKQQVPPFPTYKCIPETERNKQRSSLSLTPVNAALEQRKHQISLSFCKCGPE
jgi:hypothetical protein